MARTARQEIFSPDEIVVVYATNRVVRRCFLLGKDPVSGKNFDHRKEWIEQYLQQFAALFGIDLLAFAIASNQFHVVLRSRPDVVKTWNNKDVARRWLALCPIRKDEHKNAAEPNEKEIKNLIINAEKIAVVRSRLSDVGWWTRLLCQRVATRANTEDQEVGKFWESRFRTVRLLDDWAILACSTHVDLNPILTNAAKNLKSSNFTSAQRRIQALSATKKDGAKPSSRTATKAKSGEIIPPDRYLCPITISPRADEKSGSNISKNGRRCSNKGFLPVSSRDYLSLLEWTARQLPRSEKGLAPKEVPAILKKLEHDPATWCELVKEFGRMFNIIAGSPESVASARTRYSQRRFRFSRKARELLQPAD